MDLISFFSLNQPTILDWRSTPLMAFRNPEGVPTSLSELGDRVFSLVMMGDDRAIHATYIVGELVYGDGAIGLLEDS